MPRPSLRPARVRWNSEDDVALARRAAEQLAARFPDAEPGMVAERIHDRLLGIQRRQVVVAWAIVVATVALACWAFLSGAVQEHVGLATAALGLAVLMEARLLASLVLRKKVVPEAADARLLGSYRAAELRRLLREASRPFERAGATDSPELYVVESREGDAATTNHLLFDGLRSLNAIVIGHHLLHALRPAELRALLAHELAHFHGHVAPLGRVSLAVHAFAGVGAFGLIASIPALVGGAGLWGYVVLVPAYFGFLILAGLVSQGGEHEREHLCDHAAARHFGTTAIVNALLKLGLRQEVYLAVLEEVADVASRNDVDELQRLVAIAEEALPHGLVGPGEARDLVRAALAPHVGAKSWLRRAARGRRAEEARSDWVGGIRRWGAASRRLRKIDWRRFDTRVRDGQLDALECRDYVRALLEDPEAHAVQVDFTLGLQAGDTHPTMRQRILFIAASLPIDHPGEDGGGDAPTD